MANAADDPSGASRGGGPSGGGGQPEGGGAPASGGGSGDGSSTSWLKIFLGCGCFAILGFVCAGVGTTLASGYVVATMADRVESGVEVQQEYVDRREKVVQKVALGDALESPVGSEDYDQLVATVGTWKESEPFLELKNLIDKDYGDSFYQQLQALYQVWKSVTAFQALGEAYVDALEGHGGVEAHYRRMVRVGAVLAAVHEVATDARFEAAGDATSDEVATLIADDFERIESVYGESLSRLEGATPTFEKLAQNGELGRYALANLDAESFQSWKELEPSRREKIVESFGWSLTAEAVTFGGLPYTWSLGHDPLSVGPKGN